MMWRINQSFAYILPLRIFHIVYNKWSLLIVKNMNIIYFYLISNKLKLKLPNETLNLPSNQYFTYKFG